jgi:hypothetical protein
MRRISPAIAFVVCGAIAGCACDATSMSRDAGARRDAGQDDADVRDAAVADAGPPACGLTSVAPPTPPACGSGLTPYAGGCLRPHQPTLNVSSATVAPGDSVRVAWNGGAYGTNCAVSPWESALSGLATAAIGADTAFMMTCIDTSGAYIEPRPSIDVRVEPDAARHPYLRALGALEAARYSSWNRASTSWEVEYDGGGAPTDRTPMAFAWDNPIDDDSLADYAAGRGFRFDTPEPGFLTVDRRTDPADWIKGGVISRRDEFLDSSYGITIEFRARIFPDSGIYDGVDHDAFRLHYQMENGVVLGLFLSPTTMKAGGYALPPVAVPFDSTDFHTYRLVQDPGSPHFRVYVDDSTTPILEADGTDAYPITSVLDHEHPTIILGGEGVYRAHFTLDYVRYRRGAYPPGASIPPMLTRAPSPLPPPRPACTTDPFLPGYEGDELPNTPGSALQAYASAVPSGWTLHPDGVLELNELPGVGSYETAYVAALPGIAGQGDLTIEARVRVMPDSEPRGFSIVVSDDLGTVVLFFAPDRAELALGIKNVGHRDIGIQAAAFDATDDFHTYRLVRRAGQFYWHLYIDDDPIPRIADQHVDASVRLGPAPSATTTYLGLGHQFNPAPAHGHVLIDYVRWAPTAWGPPIR